jgi:hypothetical protein
MHVVFSRCHDDGMKLSKMATKQRKSLAAFPIEIQPCCRHLLFVVFFGREVQLFFLVLPSRREALFSGFVTVFVFREWTLANCWV